MDWIVLIILSYLIGCFSSAYFVGKLFKNMDIRTQGSGNLGATNALRVMGKKFGILTLLLDMTKGILAVILGRHLTGELGSYIAPFITVIGHNWPVFLNFKGGKGVATSLGALLALHFPSGLIGFLIGGIVVKTTKYVSLASLTFLFSTILIYPIWTGYININQLLLNMVLFILGIYRHRDNIKRLLNGTENKIGR